MNQAEALKKLQATELEILRVIRDFCTKHDITWFIDGGTLLGALRHGGFIPWDDDIDIGMPREDYERFVALAKEGLPEGYSYHDSSNTPGYAAFFGNVWKDGTSFLTDESREAGCPQGIYVDVFPYDFMAADEKRRKRQVSNARLWQSVSYLYHAKTINVPHKGLLGTLERGGCRVAHYLVRGLAQEETIRRHFENSLLRPNETSSGACLTLGWPNMKPVPLSRLIPTSSTSFEGEPFPTPGDAVFFLENTYGDWQAIPKPEDRHTHLPKYLDFGDGTSWSSEG